MWASPQCVIYVCFMFLNQKCGKSKCDEMPKDWGDITLKGIPHSSPHLEKVNCQKER